MAARSRVIVIFHNLLFTPLTELDGDGDVPEETLPCVGPQTRDTLYRLLLLLAEDESINTTIVTLLSDLVPQGGPPES